MPVRKLNSNLISVDFKKHKVEPMIEQRRYGISNSSENKHIDKVS